MIYYFFSQAKISLEKESMAVVKLLVSAAPDTTQNLCKDLNNIDIHPDGKTAYLQLYNCVFTTS